MSTHGSDDEFESSFLDSPSGLNDLLPNPFQGVIGDQVPLFTGRITRSRSSATPPLQNPNIEFVTEVAEALQTARAASTAASAPPVRNVGRFGSTSNQRNFSAEATETKMTMSDLAIVIDVMMSKYQQPPPLVSQLPPSIGTSIVPEITSSVAVSKISVPKSDYQETTYQNIGAVKTIRFAAQVFQLREGQP